MLLAQNTFSQLEGFGPSLASIDLGEITGDAASSCVWVGIGILYFCQSLPHVLNFFFIFCGESEKYRVVRSLLVVL